VGGFAGPDRVEVHGLLRRARHYTEQVSRSEPQASVDQEA